MITLTEKTWNDLKQSTLKGIIELLDASQTLLSNNGNKEICAGLYSYAFEEYGKYLRLTDYSPEKNRVEIDYYDIFRERRHEKKFKRASDDLKNRGAVECTILSKGFFDPAIFDPKIFDTRPPVNLDFQARMGVFYCDLNDTKTSIRMTPDVDIVLLEKAIRKLRDIVLSQNSS